MSDSAPAAIESIPSPPAVIGATGGSGTRIVARAAQRCGMFIGKKLNAQKDALDISAFLNVWLNSYLNRADEPDLEIRMRVYLSRVLEAYLSPLETSSMKTAPWGWKEPRSIFVLPFLAQVLPGMRFVHVVRDGRDMAFSRNQNQPLKHGEALLGPEAEVDSPAGSIALWTEGNLAAARAGEEQLGDRYLRIRYEDLCARPEAELARLLTFLELEGDPAELAGDVAPPPTIGRWREQDPEVIAELERIAHPALERFGYL
jgi:hypothetical protein